MAGGYLAARLSGAPFAARVKSGHDRAGLTLATTADFPNPAAAGATVGGPTVPAPTEADLVTVATDLPSTDAFFAQTFAVAVSGA